MDANGEEEGKRHDILVELAFYSFLALIVGCILLALDLGHERALKLEAQRLAHECLAELRPKVDDLTFVEKARASEQSAFYTAFWLKRPNPGEVVPGVFYVDNGRGGYCGTGMGGSGR